MTKPVLCFIAATLAAFAHHSSGAQFDRTSETEYRGTVVAFQWANPHASFQAMVESPIGTLTRYVFELPAPYGLEKIGWTQDTLHASDVISIRAYPAKDKSPRASVHRVVLKGGRTFEIDHPFAYADYH
jgi:hypothetical protein